MRFLLLGDVVGKAGREEVVRELPRLRHELALDFTAVNGENAAHGFGITPQICAELYAAGADVITTGNHVWDRKEIIPYIGGDPRLLRPLNFPSGTPGKGAGVFALKDGRKLVVANAMARLFISFSVQHRWPAHVVYHPRKRRRLRRTTPRQRVFCRHER